MFNRRESSGHLTGWASRLYSRSLDRRIKPLSLSVGQVPVVLLLAEERELSQKDLVARAVIEQPAMAAILKRMEAGDLVTRCADPRDGRASLFRLTRKARGVLGHLTQAIDDGNRQALAGFSAGEKALFIAMLQRVIRNLTVEENADVSEVRPTPVAPVKRRLPR